MLFSPASAGLGFRVSCSVCKNTGGRLKWVRLKIIQHIKSKWREIPLPGRWLLIFLTVVLGLSFLFQPPPKPIDLQEISFATHSSSRIYFHNVRSYYYDIFPKEKPPFVIYRLKRRLRENGRPLLQFAIIQNLAAEEAYIFAEAENDSVFEKAKVVFYQQNSVNDTVDLARMNNEKHFILAAKTYRALLRDEQMRWLRGSEQVGFLESKKARRNALTILEDYFKLIGKN